MKTYYPMRKRFETYQPSLPSGLSTVLNMRSSANSKSVCLGTLLDVLPPKKKREVESSATVAGFQPSTEVSWAICDFSDTESENQMDLFAHDSASMLKDHLGCMNLMPMGLHCNS